MKVHELRAALAALPDDADAPLRVVVEAMPTPKPSTTSYPGYATVRCSCDDDGCEGASTSFFAIKAESHEAAKAVFEEFLEEHGDAAGAALWPDAKSPRLVGWSVDAIEYLPRFDGQVMK